MVALALIGANCSGNDGPCDPVCQAQKLDEKLAGDGKISLAEREIDIGKLLNAYEAALPVSAATQAKDVETRIADLESELQLVEVIQEAFVTIQGVVEAGTVFRDDVRGWQAQLRTIYKEAEFYEPLDESFYLFYERLFDTSVTPDPAAVSEVPSSNYTIWFLVAANAHPSDVPEWFRNDVLEADDLTGYDLTHQFMTLMIQARAWPGEGWSEERKTSLALRIAEEQDIIDDNSKDYSVDLYAERIYVLMLEGYGDLIELEWLNRLLNDRLESGVWPRSTNESEPSWHATHLALLGIGSYQVVLQRGEDGKSDLFDTLKVLL